jgi:hypothetical protein
MSGSETSVRRKQRWMFASGIGVAAVPIAVQVIAAIVIWTDTAPKAFPLADDAIDSKAFWILQAILLCVAVGGSTVVDCIRVGRPKSDHRPSFVFEAILLIIISVIVALALLDKALPNAVYYVVALLSFADLGLAYRVEMDLALIDAGYLRGVPPMLAAVAVVLPIIGAVTALYGAARGSLRTRDALAAHQESDGLINVLAWIDRKLLHAQPTRAKAARDPAISTEGR